MTGTKELIGRHIYAILSVVLLCLALLLSITTRHGFGVGTVIAILLFICSVCVGAKLAYRRWSPEGEWSLVIDIEKGDSTLQPFCFSTMRKLSGVNRQCSEVHTKTQGRTAYADCTACFDVPDLKAQALMVCRQAPL